MMNIKELDPDIIKPSMMDVKNPNYEGGGSKIVIIGKPGCFASGSEAAASGAAAGAGDATAADVVCGSVLSTCSSVAVRSGVCVAGAFFDSGQKTTTSSPSA